jgi:cytosine/adenosine deaminase-related metal-dependent hydrolase
LKSGAGLAASGTSVQILPSSAFAQNADRIPPDAELTRLQGQQRILLKGGVVLTLDRQVGDFAQADVLIEDGRVSAVRPNIEVSTEAAAVIDAANHILVPGFVDTHSHSYQGILRGIMTNGVLDPDYNRDVQTKLTPAFRPADVYAGVMMTALGLIDMGTTAIVDLSQISHTPEHSNACIQALQDSGIRALYAYSRGQGPAAQYPQDVFRLQRVYFSTKDQLLTLALGLGSMPKPLASPAMPGCQRYCMYATTARGC